MNRPTALAVIGGDDVYEDLFTASSELAGLAVEVGLATRTSMGTERLAQLGNMMTGAGTDLVLLYTAMGSFPEPAQAALNGEEIGHQRGLGAQLEHFVQIAHVVGVVVRKKYPANILRIDE